MAYRYYESINQEIVSTSDANTISRNTIPKIDFVGDLDNAVLDNVNVVYYQCLLDLNYYILTTNLYPKF